MRPNTAVYPSPMSKENCRRSLRVGCRLVAAYVVASVAVGVSADTESADAAVREQFRAAYAAAALGVDTADDEALRAYVLYPYLRAARPRRALARAQGESHVSRRRGRRISRRSATRPSRRSSAAPGFRASRAARRGKPFSIDTRRRRPRRELNVSGSTRASRSKKTLGLQKDVRARWLSAYRCRASAGPPFSGCESKAGCPSSSSRRASTTCSTT
jgi:hypothetical protein